MYKTTKQYRLPGYDYSSQGAYFITICTANKINYLGNINNDVMELSKTGQLAESIWKEIPLHFKNVILDVFQFMPDHFHAILFLKESKNRPEKYIFQSGIFNNPMELEVPTLGKIVRSFKARTRYNAAKFNYPLKWQPRFHDRIIRNEKEYYLIREYIQNNPIHWNNVGI